MPRKPVACRAPLLALIALAAVAGPARATPPGPVIVEASVTATGPSPTGGEGVTDYLLEVERVVHGHVAGSTLVVHRGASQRPGGGDLAPPSDPLPGTRARWVLLPVADGSFELVRWYPLQTARPEGTTPPGILREPASFPSSSGGDRRTAAVAAGPSFEEQVVDLVNQQRWSFNNLQLPPLKGVDLLANSAGGHSAAMADRDFFAHCDPDTLMSPFDRMTAAGYFWIAAAENIAAGYSTPTAVMDGWMASPGHRANILSTSFREIGVGYVLQSTDAANVRIEQTGDCTIDLLNQGPFFRYWTQNFGSRSGVYPLVIDREAFQTTTTAVDLYVYGAGFAQDMRFSNDGVNWSAWQTYNPDKAWTLSSGGGLKTVHAQIRNGTTVLEASDDIVLATTCTAPDQLNLASQTVGTTTTFDACTTITATSGFQVASTGNVTFHAGSTIVLGSGFSVASGGTFTAFVDPFL